jgi:hypothetical protein
MKNYKKKLVSHSNSRGGVLVLVTFLLVVLVGVTALAIDIGYLNTTRNELQNVADAAALAGAGYLGAVYAGLPSSEHTTHLFNRDDIVAVVPEIAGKNKASRESVSINDNATDIKIGLWDAGARDITVETLTASDAVYVKARRDNQANSPISTFFARIFNINDMSVTAEAWASLSGPSAVEEGALKLPIGISDNVFPDKCGDVIAFSPTTDSCAGWHNFFDDINASSEADKLLGFIQGYGEDPCEFCDGGLTNGPAWLTDIFDLNSTPTPAVTPISSEGDYFDFQGGAIASLLTGVLLDTDYNGNSGTVIKSNGDIASNTSKPMPMMALFDYFKYRDGDDDFTVAKDILDADGNVLYQTGDVIDKDKIWSATIPVYRDDAIPPACDNPTGRTEIVGFARVKVIAPNPPPSTNLNVSLDCEFTVIEGRGGGGTFGNLRGTIPSLVR